MTTARTIIKKALQKIGALYKSEEPSADEANDGLYSLNAMLSSWSNDQMLVYANVTESFMLQGGVQAYTMGPGGDFDTVRPVQIDSVYTSISNLDYTCEPISTEDFAGATFKILQSPWPEFYNNDNGFPLITLKFLNIPAGAYGITFNSEKPLTSFSSLDADISMPPGWEHALIYNLAIILAPEYGQQADQVTVQIARDALNVLQNATIRNQSMDFEYNIDTSQNIYGGWFYR